MLYEDHSSGDRYNLDDLGKLFETVLGNPNIIAAALQNLLGTSRATADEPILRFANALPDSSLISANLGEYTASSETWDLLLVAITQSQLGHLYISEQNLSNLSAQQKVDMRTALARNREEAGYLSTIVEDGAVHAVRKTKPWFEPKDTATWLTDKKARLARLLNG